MSNIIWVINTVINTAKQSQNLVESATYNTTLIKKNWHPYIYIYIYIYIPPHHQVVLIAWSSLTLSFPSLSPSIPIVYRTWHILEAASSVRIELMKVSFRWITKTSVSMCCIPPENVTYEFVRTSPEVPSMSCSSYFDSLCDGGEWTVQLLFCGVFLPGLVQNRGRILIDRFFDDTHLTCRHKAERTLGRRTFYRKEFLPKRRLVKRHLAEKLLNLNIYYILAYWLERSPMARETWVQSQVESYQRLKKMVLDVSLLNTQHYKVRIKG